MNKQTIGFDRELQLSWLDLAAGLVQQGLDLQSIRMQLLDRLAEEVPGQEACRKTVTVLTRLWLRVPEEHIALQREALTLLPDVLPEDRLWLHWGMSMLAYPFFYDVTATVGRLLKLHGEVDSLQVRRRMRENWGQRTTLDRAIRRVLQTLVDWDTLQSLDSDAHLYRAVPLRQTTNPALALWFIESLIQGTRQASGHPDQQLPLAELIQSPAVYPFDITSHAATLRRSDRFEISRQGLDLEMVAPV